jgi:eukaryotic-like serine/threonine-protein kinase
LTNETGDEALLDIALAVADGNQIPDHAFGGQLNSEDVAIVDALRLVSRLAQVRRSSAAVPFAPTRWGHLNVLGVSHRGSETQYAARDDTLGREVVLTLVGPLEGDAARTEELLQRARLRTRVSHPNLANVYGADYAQDRVGYWAEHVDGRSLVEIMASGGRYGVMQASQIVAAVCGAVGAVHAAGLSNGGVPPADVVESADGRIVLLASVCARLPGDSRLPCTPETDIVDIGALLVFLLTGVPVDRSMAVGSVVDRLRHGRPDIRPRVVDVIERSLNPDAGRGFSNVAELERALRAAMTDSPVTAESVIGFVVTALVIVLLLWYALAVQ